MTILCTTSKNSIATSVLAAIIDIVRIVAFSIRLQMSAYALCRCRSWCKFINWRG